MKFRSCDEPLTDADITEIETDLGLELPGSLRALYLQCNGGDPDPYCYADAHVDTVVTALLPLRSRQSYTAVNAYRDLTTVQRLVPRQFFPFAADGGGNLFLVDCASSDGDVYFYRSDTAFEDTRLEPLNLDVNKFWSSLKPEDEA